jgi:predicted phosphodiesterase
MKSLKQDVVREYIDKYPELPNKMLAELIFTREEGLFSSAENARSNIRYYKGAHGEALRKHAQSAGHFTEPTISTIQEGLRKLGVISRSEAPEHVQLGEGRYLILSDIHIPFQDDKALACALEFGVRNKATHVILNGDLVDMYDASKYDKEIKRPRISEELEMTRHFFEVLRDLYPTQPIYYKFGNHCERMRHYVLRNAREMADIEDISLENLLRLEHFNIVPVGREMIKIGKLTVLHGHELAESVFSPVNAARGMFIKAKTSVIFGHNHQISHHSESNLHGEQVGVWSMGCLCELTPGYRPYGYLRWAHGFAFVEVNADGTFHVNNMRILDGKII